MNKCKWLLLGSTDVCGRACRKEFCSVHNARLKKSRGTVACQKCGKGVKTTLNLCKTCGAAYIKVVRWRKKQALFRKEFHRLAAINSS